MTILSLSPGKHLKRDASDSSGRSAITTPAACVPTFRGSLEPLRETSSRSISGSSLAFGATPALP